jgi:hypothetical protein
VVVHNRQSVAALPIRKRKVTLEVHLPKPVGRLFLEALKWGVAPLFRSWGLPAQKPASLYDVLAGGGGRHLLDAKGAPSGSGLP